MTTFQNKRSPCLIPILFLLLSLLLFHPEAKAQDNTESKDPLKNNPIIEAKADEGIKEKTEDKKQEEKAEEAEETEEESEEEDEEEEITVDCKCVDDELECSGPEANKEAEDNACSCDEGEVWCEGKEYKLGQELYDAFCARCHGFEGDGKGEASNFTYPKPRDFTSGMFKFHSTASGEPPTDEDLKRGILKGFPGTSMFGW